MASDPNHYRYVSSGDLAEKLDKIPDRREMRLTIALALLGGQALASVVAAWVTRLSPPAQVAALAHLIVAHL